MGCLVCRGYHDHVLVCIHDVVFYLSIYIPFIDVVCTKTFKVIFASMLMVKVTAYFVDEYLLNLLYSVDEMDIKCFFYE